MMLTKAVNEHRADIVQFLLSNGMTPPAGSHLLHTAVAAGDLATVKALLACCPVDDREEKTGNTPLHLAETAEMAELLLNGGAAVDTANRAGRHPHETVRAESVRKMLKARYDRLHPAPRPAETLIPTETNWKKRFTQELLSLHDLIPVNDENDPDAANIRCGGTEYHPSKRFYASLARKLKFSTNVFRYFSPKEFLTRVYEREPDLRFKVTFDMESGELLGVTDPDKKMLPPQVACQVIAADPRTRSLVYEEGVWEANLLLDEKFKVPRAGDYYRQLQVRYPVDGVGSPCIYLAHMRVVCNNGAVASVAEFRTDLEVNDQSGMHLGKLLKSFSNDYGFSAMTERMVAAQDTLASVGELLNIDAMIADNLSDKNAYREIHDRLNAIAGDPCYRYGVTSLQSIPRKRQALLPVECSVNDLLNVLSELTTHHSELLHRPRVFDEKLGQMLAQEFDLEGMYRSGKRVSPDFFLKGLKLDGPRAEESVVRKHNQLVA